MLKFFKNLYNYRELLKTSVKKEIRGKYTFFNMFPFSTMVNADLDIAAEKKVHGINPQQINIE